MTDFLKFGMNRQNMAIEKALQSPAAASAAQSFEIFSVDRDTVTSPTDGKEIRVGEGKVGAILLSDEDPATYFPSEFSYYTIINGFFQVYGTGVNWSTWRFLVF